MKGVMKTAQKYAKKTTHTHPVGIFPNTETTRTWRPTIRANMPSGMEFDEGDASFKKAVIANRRVKL